jgi:hypothetical protein
VKTLPQVTRENSADLSFAWACLLSGTIGMEDFTAWAETVVATMPSDDLPPYMIDLMMAESHRDLTVGICDIIGFWPSTDFDAQTQAAFDGLVYLRDAARPDDMKTPRQKALAALQQKPDLKDQFTRMFPSLTLDETE